MARGNAFVRIHDHKVQEFLVPGGEVNDLVHDTAKLTRYFARGHINDRTGTLGRMIQVNRPSRKHALAVSSLVFTRTEYALYVHEGTANNGAGYIRPTNGTYLTIPRNHKSSTVSGGTLRKIYRSGKAESVGGRPYFLAKEVHGQKANPFLDKGLNEAMGLLR